MGGGGGPFRKKIKIKKSLFVNMSSKGWRHGAKKGGGRAKKVPKKI